VADGEQGAIKNHAAFIWSVADLLRGDWMTKLPRIGTRVLVPFGRGRSEGEVVDAYGSIGPYVRVAIDLLGTDEPLTVTFPLDQVEPANTA